jgi:hypothetical protein
VVAAVCCCRRGPAARRIRPGGSIQGMPPRSPTASITRAMPKASSGPGQGYLCVTERTATLVSYRGPMVTGMVAALP